MRTMIVLAVAVITGALASTAVYSAVTRIPVREVEVAHQYIVVASQPLPIGTRLTKEHVSLVAWPKAHPVSGGFTSIDAVVGRGVTTDVLANEPITESRVATLDSGAGLPLAIPPGMRAISVKVDEVVGVAGFVVPGTYVDVLVSLKPGTQEQVARAVASNLRVLTAGTRYDQEEAKHDKPIRSTVVTLMVTPEDAERVALAQTEGNIILTLRNPLDTAATVTPGVGIAALVGSAPPAPVVRKIVERPSAPPPSVAAPLVEVARPYTVEAIRAAKRSEEVVPR
jgi:pilus assembly protein CpaB